MNPKDSNPPPSPSSSVSEEVKWTQKVIKDCQDGNIAGIITNLVHFVYVGDWEEIEGGQLYWRSICPGEACDGSCLECSWSASILINTEKEYVRIRGFHPTKRILDDDYWLLFKMLLPSLKKKLPAKIDKN